MHRKKEDMHQSSLILQDFYDHLFLGIIFSMFQTHLGDICLNGSLFDFVYRQARDSLAIYT